VLLITVYISPDRLCVTAMWYCRMSPFCSSNCGGCHVSNTDLDPTSLSVRFSGGPVGTVSVGNRVFHCLLSALDWSLTCLVCCYIYWRAEYTGCNGMGSNCTLIYIVRVQWSHIYMHVVGKQVVYLPSVYLHYSYCILHNNSIDINRWRLRPLKCDKSSANRIARNSLRRSTGSCT